MKTYYQFAVSYRRSMALFMVKPATFQTANEVEIAARKYVSKNASWGQRFRVLRMTMETLIQT